MTDTFTRITNDNETWTWTTSRVELDDVQRKELLLIVMRLREIGDLDFDMNHWGGTRTEWQVDSMQACGTVGCIAGHRLFQAGWTLTDGSTFVSPEGEIGNPVFTEVAGELMGFANDEIDALFFQSRWPGHEAENQAYPFATPRWSYEQLIRHNWNNIGRDAAINVIEDLLDGEIELWNKVYGRVRAERRYNHSFFTPAGYRPQSDQD